eukprot:3079632-Ditylum_brightwellii.AAC.1
MVFGVKAIMDGAENNMIASVDVANGNNEIKLFHPQSSLELPRFEGLLLLLPPYPLPMLIH